MADLGVKMGVSGIAQFKQGMSEAQASVKTLDASLKANEKTLRATGDSEQYMQKQTALLNQKLQQQQAIAKNAEAALKQMEENGVKKTSVAYQNMQRQLVEAQSGMMDTQMALDGLGTKATDAAQKTDQLSSSLGGLNRKMSLDQVISGIGSITSAMENAGKKAVELGKKIWENITDSAQWADDAATQAMILNMDVEDYQRYKKVFDTVGELTVKEWKNAKRRVQSAINDPSEDQTNLLNLLGINTHEILQGKTGAVQGAARDFEDVFWEIGETLRRKVESGEMTQDLADVYSNALFGKGFAELNPMFALGQEGFKKALEEQNVVTEESVDKLASLNDQLVKLKGDFDTLSSEVMAGLAPGLEKAAKALDGLLAKVIEYLQTEKGQEMLQNLSDSFSKLFDGLSEIDPESVVESFTTVFDGLIKGLQWVVDHQDGVVGALTAIVGGWATLEITGGILEIVKIVQGIQGLTNAGVASAAGKAAGSAWGSGFVSAVMAAAPWLIGLYTLLNPGDTADNNLDTIYDPETHELTQAGIDAGITMDYDEFMNWQPKNRQRWSAEWDPDWVWENQLEHGNAWVSLTQDQSDAVQKFYDIFRESGDFTDADWEAYEKAFEGQEDLFNKMDELFNNFVQAHEGELPEDLPDDLFKVTADIEIPDDEAETLAKKIGIVKVSARIVPFGYVEQGEFANGLPYVPFDGYHAVLHKGERVMPAREVSSRSFSSNLYVESMIMNNGTDAEGLAAAIAAANQRTMRGYGS